MREDRLYEINYGYWFNMSNERAYHHLDVLLNLVQLVGGSAAALAAFQEKPGFVIASGLALAICAAIALLVQPSVKSEQHRVCKAQWLALRGRASQMDDDQLTAAVAETQAGGPNGLGILQDIAFNATCRAAGNEHAVVELSRLQRIAAAVA
ncbi:MAG: hypothetical protein QE265_04845 [Rhodoferax sp.]|nr:hypothetical protein [Rhodoferax sp.]